MLCNYVRERLCHELREALNILAEVMSYASLSTDWLHLRPE